VSFRTEGDPPDVYHLLIATPGLVRDGAGGLTTRRVHRCVAYLHLDYPRRPPVITWLTPVLHPNILPPERNGGVCIGAWSAGESLADLSLPTEAFVRLVYGRLDPEHTPAGATAEGISLDELRQAFPGV
jgi:hypothetical protein